MVGGGRYEQPRREASVREELERLRRREEHYRHSLEEAHARAEASRRMTLAIGDLSASATLSRRGLLPALEEMVVTAASVTGAERTSVWLPLRPFP